MQKARAQQVNRALPAHDLAGFRMAIDCPVGSAITLGIPAEQGVQSKKTRFSFAPDKAVWINSFPSGLSSAPCELTFPAGPPRELDFVAGYFAVEQNVEDLALSPVIGWSITNHAPATPVMVTRFPVDAESD